MGTNLSPQAVTKGLILLLDPQNPKSFRGEPTTNVMPATYRKPTVAWGVANYQTSTCTAQIVTEDGESAMKLTSVINNADYPRVTSNPFSSSIPANSPFSVTFETKGTPGATFNFRMYSSGSTKVTLVSPALTGEWQKVKFETQTSTFILDTAYINPLTTGATYFIRNIQVEVKPYATPFVDGVRDGYVANNGGVYDLSGTGNHSFLVGNTVGNTTTNGIQSLMFDGAGDALNFTSGTLIGDNTLPQQITIDFWCNFDLTTPPADGSYQRGLLGYYGGGTTLNCKMSANAIFTDVIDVAAARTITYNTAAVAANTWTHVSTTFDTGNLITYTNGLQYATATIAANVAFAANTFTIGSGYGYYDYFGKMGIVKVYNRVLSPAEVKQNYDAMRGRYNV